MLPAFRPLRDTDVDAVVELGLRAWTPVFAAMRTVLGDAIFHRLHPDWARAQADEIRATCTRADLEVYVAGEEPVAFAAIFFNEATLIGTIEMLAVDPAAQGQGIGTALTEFAVERIRERGMTMAFVETGGDPGHAAARRTYEAAGFTALPAVRYFRIVAES